MVGLMDIKKTLSILRELMVSDNEAIAETASVLHEIIILEYVNEN